MTLLKRRILTVVFILLFLFLAPIIIFYANGTIMGDGWNILATGGVSIRSMESGSQLFVNGKLKDTASFFTRDYFLKNLRPGIYTILVKKDGYNDLTNKILVYPNKVVESNVFMLPKEIVITEIRKFNTDAEQYATSTKEKPKANPNYEIISALFSTSSMVQKYTSVLQSTTSTTTKYRLGTKENPIKNRRLVLWSDKNSAFLGWDGNIDSAPKIFCEYVKDDIKCDSQLTIYSFSEPIKNLDFFLGNMEIVIVSVGDKIFAIEAEQNPDKKPQLIYSGKKPDFRVLNNTIYIKDDNFLGQVEI